MWHLNRIYCKNFLSFENLNFDFKKQCYIVAGKNEDNNSQTSNGSGKTAFIDIIAILLIGDSLTYRNLKESINWTLDSDFFTIGGELENFEHGLTCTIERKIYSKNKSGELSILVNDKVPKIPTKQGVKNGVDVKAGNEYILKEILDIKKQDLLNYFLISKNYYQPFLQVNTDKKLEVIGRFTNTTAVDKTISKLENELEIDEDSKQEYVNQISQAEGYIQALQSSLTEEAEIAFQEKKDDQLVKIGLRLEDVAREIDKLEKEQKEVETKIKTLQSSKIQIEERERNYLLNELSKITHDCGQTEELESEVQSNIYAIKHYLLGLISCPKCHHKFNVESQDNFTDEDLKEAEESLQIVRDELQLNNESLKVIKEGLKEIEEQELANKRIQSEIQSLERNVKYILQNTDRLLKEFNKLELENETVAAKIFADEKADTLERIGEKEREIKSLTIQLQELNDSIDLRKKWIDLFADFKFYLGNKPLSIICSLVNEYLKLNGSDLNLHIEGFKKLRSGEIRQALEPVIYRSWMNPRSYHSFSEGEKVRLNISTDLAFQQLINSSSKYGGLSLYVNDELLANCDSQGVLNAATAFNTLNKTMLLVTHSAESINFANTITVEKKNGISRII